MLALMLSMSFDKVNKDWGSRCMWDKNVQKRFTHIVNHLIGLGKQFDKELNIKILKCLDRSWQPKVMEISETRDLTTLKTAALFGKLREHELEMIRLRNGNSGEKDQELDTQN